MPTVSSHHPYLISIGVSPYIELARGLLDRLGIPYHEESHVPVFHALPARRHGGSGVVPVLDTAETTLTPI